MNQENSNQSQGAPCCGGSENKCAFGCTCKWAFSRALAVVKDPKNIWNEIKAENHTVLDIFKKYIFIIAAVPALGQLIHGIFNGVFPIAMAVMTYLITLASAWLSSFIMKYIAPKFGGTNDQATCLKLVAYAAAPAWLGGIFYLIPMGPVAALLVLACSLYGIYVFWQGIPPVVGVPPEKRLVFLIVMVVVYIVISIVLSMLLIPFVIATAVTSGTIPS